MQHEYKFVTISLHIYKYVFRWQWYIKYPNNPLGLGRHIDEIIDTNYYRKYVWRVNIQLKFALAQATGVRAWKAYY